MTYEDLLIVPYKENGRDENGMDCYGFVIELFRRAGKKLKDITDLKDVPEADLYKYVCSFGVTEKYYSRAGYIAQWAYNGKLHLGYMISKKDCIHMTYTGAQYFPIDTIEKVRFFEVE